MGRFEEALDKLKAMAEEARWARIERSLARIEHNNTAFRGINLAPSRILKGLARPHTHQLFDEMPDNSDVPCIDPFLASAAITPQVRSGSLQETVVGIMLEVSNISPNMHTETASNIEMAMASTPTAEETAALPHNQIWSTSKYQPNMVTYSKSVHDNSIDLSVTAPSNKLGDEILKEDVQQLPLASGGKEPTNSSQSNLCARGHGRPTEYSMFKTLERPYAYYMFAKMPAQDSNLQDLASPHTYHLFGEFYVAMKESMVRRFTDQQVVARSIVKLPAQWKNIGQPIVFYRGRLIVVAHQVFDKMHARDMLKTSLFFGDTQSNQGTEAFCLFERMLTSGLFPLVYINKSLTNISPLPVNSALKSAARILNAQAIKHAQLWLSCLGGLCWVSARDGTMKLKVVVICSIHIVSSNDIISGVAKHVLDEMPLRGFWAYRLLGLDRAIHRRAMKMNFASCDGIAWVHCAVSWALMTESSDSGTETVRNGVESGASIYLPTPAHPELFVDIARKKDTTGLQETVGGNDIAWVYSDVQMAKAAPDNQNYAEMEFLFGAQRWWSEDEMD